MTAPRIPPQKRRGGIPNALIEAMIARAQGMQPRPDSVHERMIEGAARPEPVTQDETRRGGIAAAIAGILARRNPQLGDLGRLDDINPERTSAMRQISPEDQIRAYGTDRAVRENNQLDRVASRFRRARRY